MGELAVIPVHEAARLVGGVFFPGDKGVIGIYPLAGGPDAHQRVGGCDGAAEAGAATAPGHGALATAP